MCLSQIAENLLQFSLCDRILTGISHSQAFSHLTGHFSCFSSNEILLIITLIQRTLCYNKRVCYFNINHFFGGFLTTFKFNRQTNTLPKVVVIFNSVRLILVFWKSSVGKLEYCYINFRLIDSCPHLVNRNIEKLNIKSSILNYRVFVIHACSI